MDSNLLGDVYIDNERVPIRAYNRSSADEFVARFGSPEKGQSNLDLLKAVTQKSFRGGMFQKHFDDDEMADYIRGGQYNKLDKKLYFSPLMGRYDVSVPAPNKNSVSTNMDANCATAKCFFNGFLYIAYRNYPSGAITNRLDKIDLETNTRTSITLPAAIANATCPITDMIPHRDKIFLTGKSDITDTAFHIHRYDGATTFVSLTTTSGMTFRKLVSFRDKLYAMGLSDFYAVTNEMSGTTKYTNIKASVGYRDGDIDNVHSMHVFNGAVYICKADGLYRFDGVEVNVVFDFRSNASLDNFRLAATFNGRFYWVFKNTLYEFDGTNLAPLQDFSDGYYIISLEAASDRLLIGARYNKSSKSIYPSENFPDPLEIESYTYAAIVFDGVGFFEYASELHDTKNTNLPLGFPVVPTLVSGFSRLAWIFPITYANVSLEPRSNGYYFYNIDLLKEFDVSQIGNDRKLEIFGSSMDFGYPSVTKVLNGIDVDCDGFDAENVTLEVYVRTNNRGVISDWELAWSTAHTVSDGIDRDYLLHDESTVASPELDLAPPKFNSIEYYVLAKVAEDYTVTVIPRISEITLRYTLQPDLKKQWSLTIPIRGVDHDDFDTPEGETREATYIRNVLQRARDNSLPVLFYDLDYSKITASDSGVIAAKGENWLNNKDVIAMKDSDRKWLNRRISDVVYDNNNHRTSFELNSVALRRVIGASSKSLSDYFGVLANGSWSLPEKFICNSWGDWGGLNGTQITDKLEAIDSDSILSDGISGFRFNLYITSTPFEIYHVLPSAPPLEFTTEEFVFDVNIDGDTFETAYVGIGSPGESAVGYLNSFSPSGKFIKKIKYTVHHRLNAGKWEVDYFTAQYLYVDKSDIGEIVPTEIRKSHAVYVKNIESETIVAGVNEANDHDGHSDYDSLMVVHLQEI